MHDTRPKPSGETLGFMQVMFGLVHALDVRSKRMAHTIGVTGPQRLVVRMIGQRAGRTATEIAELLEMHPSTLTGVLARLEKRGAIVRDIDVNDRRRSRFRLTATGRRIDKERRGTVEAAVRRALGRAETVSVTHTEGLMRLLAAELMREEDE
jgi:DNA-binding MarR family transcriptional regulator|nr:MarR family transcriptional regulator [Kofleriaceae bacterium]